MTLLFNNILLPEGNTNFYWSSKFSVTAYGPSYTLKLRDVNFLNFVQ